MSGWRKLSERGNPVVPEAPPEDLPDYLKGPVVDWVIDRIQRAEDPDDALERLQLAFRLDPPLPLWASNHAFHNLQERMSEDDRFALDVLDYVLHHAMELLAQYEQAFGVIARPQAILTRGGSAWEVVDADGDGYAQLALRALGPTRESIEDLPPNSRAREHLTIAWNRLMGRDPDPSTAYREAIKAVEAVAKPVILPTNNRTTLGTMIAAMRDAPQKWTTTLGAVEDVQRLMSAVWQGQVDRHGTDDPDAPLAVSQEEADFAVHICVALVRMFAGGHVRRAD
jgi:hypothetical protein